MESRSTSVRVDQDTLDRLGVLADQTGLSKARLITLAVRNYVEHVERSGSVSVPLGSVREKRAKHVVRKSGKGGPEGKRS